MTVTMDARRFLERAKMRSTYRRPIGTVVPGDSAIHDYPVDRPFPRASGILNGAPNPDRASTQNDPWHLGPVTPRTVVPVVPEESSSSSSVQTTTLLEHATAQIDDRIRGLDPNVAVPMFTVRDGATETYVRNTSFWAADVDMTCLVPWNDDNHMKSATLITPKHVISVTHLGWYPPIGSVLHFVTMGNVVEKRTLMSWTDVTYIDPSTGPQTADMRIGELSSDLPGTITPAKLLPAEADVKFAGPGYLFAPITEENKAVGMPVFVGNSRSAREDGQVMDIGGLYPEVKYRTAWYYRSYDPTRDAFYPNKINSGDSGDVTCAIVNGELALINMHTSILTQRDGGTGRPFLSGMAADINALLPVGYELGSIDISGFPDVGPMCAWRASEA